MANASFLSDFVTIIMGSETQASEIEPVKEVIHNSQTVPLLESSINPDLKNIKEEPVVIDTPEDALIANNGVLSLDSDLSKFASSTKITTYTVKKGDTLDGISEKLKIPKSTIIASNADLKKSDMIKIGQKLVIFAIKNPNPSVSPVMATADKKDVTSDKVKSPLVEKVADKKDTPEDSGTLYTINTELLPSAQAKISVTTPTNEDQSPSGQPTGTINGGYIWPFPEGVGRVSQGRHGDNAFDFAAPKNTPIYAVQSGTVLIVHPTGYNGGFGKYVVINFNDGRQAIFGHMNKTAVEEGQIVKQGDIIGYVGSTGKSTGPHTHIGFHGDLPNPYLGLKVNSTGIDHD